MLILVCSGGVRAQNRAQGVLPSALTAQDRTGTIWGAGEGGTIFRWTEVGGY